MLLQKTLFWTHWFNLHILPEIYTLFFLGMKRLSIRRTMLDNVCAGRQACRNASYVLGNLSHTNGTIFCPKIYCRCIIGLNPWHFWIPQLLLYVIFKILGKKHVVYSKTVKDFSSRLYTCSQLPWDLLRRRGGGKMGGVLCNFQVSFLFFFLLDLTSFAS